MIWARYVDPECPDIPRPGTPTAIDAETEEIDRRHRADCFRCMYFATFVYELERDDEAGE